MTSLYAKAWKCSALSLLKLLLRLWSFVLYLRSFGSPSATRQPSYTPKQHMSKQPEIDLEGGQTIILDLRASDSPSAETPSPPCVRRPRATTLSGHSTPSVTSRRAIASRSSALSFSFMDTGAVNDSRLSDGSLFSVMDIGVVNDNRLSDGSFLSFITARSTHSSEMNEDGSTSYDTDIHASFFANHRDSRDLNSVKLKRVPLGENVSLPLKCLSATKTLTFASPTNLYMTTHRRTLATSVPATALVNLGSSQETGYIDQSCSVDRGLSMMQQVLRSRKAMDQKARHIAGENITRRPKSIAFPVSHEVHIPGSVFSDDNMLNVRGSRLTSQCRHTYQGKQVLERWHSGFGLHDVSYVKRMFSVMRADAEKEAQEARNLFNRESVLTYRKSAAPSKAVRFSQPPLSANVKFDENNLFINRISIQGKHHSQAPLVVPKKRVLSFNSPKVASTNWASRSRHKSATYGLDVSPSMHLQLKVEKIKRQRKARQEMMARMNTCSYRQKNRETYDWCAEEAQV